MIHYADNVRITLKNYKLLSSFLIKSTLVPRNALLKILRNRTLVDDGIITVHDVSQLYQFKFDTAFTISLMDLPDQIVETYKPTRWRAHIFTWAADQSLKVEGDFVDCGVWYGVLSKTVCEFFDFQYQPRAYYLFDTWGSGEKVQNNSKYIEDIYSIVMKRFEKFPNVKLVRGLIPDSLNNQPISSVAFLSLDMNGGEAELNALEYFYPKLSSGAFVYLDDYGQNFPTLRENIDRFLRDKPERLLTFPTGNAIFVKK